MGYSHLCSCMYRTEVVVNSTQKIDSVTFFTAFNFCNYVGTYTT